ncbi:MAG: 2-C-methyl-D-erythritol 4-phosphate cytidylyltransferase [Lachnospiraceae bacterium]|nr:2-C-methyl-D-erythritol 4-phosphate cytidylyltransferase [Lachnospiraceae bacterium]
MKTAAVVLAGGSGKRMHADVPKQYMTLCGHPLLYYSLRAFEDSFIDEIVLVTAAGEEEHCREMIVERYGFDKVRAIVPGGKERYHSVMHGVKAVSTDTDYIFIHDGARPFITQEILKRVLGDVQEKKACVVGMPVKDTIKIADEDGFVADTPKRALVWQVQTPQVFAAELIRRAYGMLEKEEAELLARGVEITDDAMIVELLTKQPVYLTQGSYENIKITTPEDMGYAEWQMAERLEK